ncbi:MAG TPA: energy transducer TonB [Syntrophales bacterium]|nr:energy transducer TonB [Syntrophales bacterium]HPQ42687.1 energy transducer TonB [Syntrophales bacterium]
MIPRKIFVIAIILSLAVHIVLLALSGFLRSHEGTDGDVFTVSLDLHPYRSGETNNNEQKTSPDASKDAGQSAGKSAVDTIDLDSTDTKYYPYLIKIKESIDDRWSYPQDAYIRGEGGTTVIEFSIMEQGALADSRVIVSSGYELLDTESLYAIRSSAPFAPFPVEFGLAKLNIVAKFRYSLGE